MKNKRRRRAMMRGSFVATGAILMEAISLLKAVDDKESGSGQRSMNTAKYILATE